MHSKVSLTERPHLQSWSKNKASLESPHCYFGPAHKCAAYGSADVLVRIRRAKFTVHLSGLHLGESAQALLQRCHVNDLKSLKTPRSNDEFWHNLYQRERKKNNKKTGISPKSYVIARWTVLAKDLNTIYGKYCASLSALVPLHPTARTIISSYACISFHLTPTFWTKIFLAAMKMVFFCCAFLRQETLFSCKLLTGSPRTMQL